MIEEGASTLIHPDDFILFPIHNDGLYQGENEDLQQLGLLPNTDFYQG